MLVQVLRDNGFRFKRQDTGVGVWTRLVEGKGHRDGLVAIISGDRTERWAVAQSNGSAVTGKGADELIAAIAA